MIAAARVRGFQGKDLGDEKTMMACVKHFAAYGAPQAGRDYNTVDMSERSLYEWYLPPYKAASDAGAGSFMTSFNRDCRSTIIIQQVAADRPVKERLGLFRICGIRLDIDTRTDSSRRCS